MRPSSEPLYTVEKIIGKSKEGEEVLYKTKCFKLCPWVVDEFEAEQAIVRSIDKDLANILEGLPSNQIKKRVFKRRHKKHGKSDNLKHKRK